MLIPKYVFELCAGMGWFGVGGGHDGHGAVHEGVRLLTGHQ